LVKCCFVLSAFTFIFWSKKNSKFILHEWSTLNIWFDKVWYQKSLYISFKPYPFDSYKYILVLINSMMFFIVDIWQTLWTFRLLSEKSWFLLFVRFVESSYRKLVIVFIFFTFFKLIFHSLNNINDCFSLWNHIKIQIKRYLFSHLLNTFLSTVALLFYSSERFILKAAPKMLKSLLQLAILILHSRFLGV